ncbi:MAG: hypothetical protein K8F91_24305 [Candidatus Obscuribacterales bacterium]|nr:hypothetical protein [Candidatus Obscuribacterales bacterium]
MFEVDKGCSHDREQLERLWRKGASASPAQEDWLDDRGRHDQRHQGSWSSAGTLAAGWLLAMLLATIFTAGNTIPSRQLIQEVLSPITNLIPMPPVIATAKSTMTGIIDSRSLTAAYYWTIVLRSDNTNQNTGEFDLIVPAGTAVNRVTLWVDGVPQEAAFNASQKVQTAFSSIINENRDPILVTWKAPGRYRIKVFPVNSYSDFKFRVGMTAPIDLDKQGRMALALPHIENANLRFDAVQDIHLESDVPLSAAGHGVDSEKVKDGFLIRANLPAEQMASLSMHGVRGTSLKSFATRATHSNPAAFIVANLEQNSGSRHLVLNKSLSRPGSASLIKEEAVAHRLSTLWAAGEIEELIERGDRSQAVDLAMTYRLVSQVSAATALEDDDDYDQFGLHRQMYRTSNYLQQESPAIADKVSSTATFASGISGDESLLQSSSNGSFDPQADDAEVLMGINSTGTVSVNRLISLDSLGSFAGSVFYWAVPSVRDANNFGDSNIVSGPATETNLREFGPLSLFTMLLVAIPVLSLASLSFLGAAMLAIAAIKTRSEPGMRNALMLLSALWFVFALMAPGWSQVLLLIVALKMIFSQKGGARPAT